MTIDLMVEMVGAGAGILTTASFVPQVVKVWRTKRTDDLSLVMYLMLWTGILMWLIYGLYLNSFSLVMANGVTLFLATAILYFKLRYDVFKRPAV